MKFQSQIINRIIKIDMINRKMFDIAVIDEVMIAVVDHLMRRDHIIKIVDMIIVREKMNKEILVVDKEIMMTKMLFLIVRIVIVNLIVVITHMINEIVHKKLVIIYKNFMMREIICS